MLDLLAKLLEDKILSYKDYYLAKMLASHLEAKNLAATELSYADELAIFLVAILSLHSQQGHTFLKLDDFDSAFYSLEIQGISSNLKQQIKAKLDNIPPNKWADKLADHLICNNSENSPALLKFAFNGVYFYRNFIDEQELSSKIVSLASNSQHVIGDKTQQIEVLDNLFASSNGLDWQKISALLALNSNFCLISGGPGTGKTTTVSKFLIAAQTLSLQQGKAALKICLVAPTGKAASRLSESITKSLTEIAPLDHIKNSIPQKAQTIHKLLSLSQYNPAGKYGVSYTDLNMGLAGSVALNYLDLDILIVDEASMVSLDLMVRLVNSLPSHAKLLLLGDKDQLSAVESGAVVSELADFMDKFSLDFIDKIKLGASSYAEEDFLKITAQQGDLEDIVISLKKSYRFDSGSDIGKLVNLVKAENSQDSLALLKNSNDLIWHSVSQQADYFNSLISNCATEYSNYLAKINQLNSIDENLTKEQLQQIFTAFNQVRVLSPLRIGDFGVENLNLVIAERLRKLKLISFNNPDDWYQGKPVIILENREQVGVYNGDIGICLYQNGRLRLFLEQDGGFKALNLRQVPRYESAYVLTVHKSQGSEFAHVIFALPLNNSKILTKELLYTGLSRAKSKITLYCNEKIWKIAISSKTMRQSALSEQLRLAKNSYNK